MKFVWKFSVIMFRYRLMFKTIFGNELLRRKSIIMAVSFLYYIFFISTFLDISTLCNNNKFSRQKERDHLLLKYVFYNCVPSFLFQVCNHFSSIFKQLFGWATSIVRFVKLISSFKALIQLPFQIERLVSKYNPFIYKD